MLQASKRAKVKDESQKRFVLVDESHRSKFTETAHAAYERMLPNAAFIGFTGHSFIEIRKGTARKFGGLYTLILPLDQAGKDGAVLPFFMKVVRKNLP